MADQLERPGATRLYFKNVANEKMGVGNYPPGMRVQYEASGANASYVYFNDDKRYDGTPIVKPKPRPAGLGKKPKYDIDMTVEPTLGEKYATMKTDQLNRAVRAGYTVSELRMLAEKFDESVVQGSINAIGSYVSSAKDPRAAYLNVLQHPKIMAGKVAPTTGSGLPLNLSEAFNILINQEDRQKVLDHALKAWTDANRQKEMATKVANDENKVLIKDGEKAFNVLMAKYGTDGMTDKKFLREAKTIISKMGALGYEKLSDMQDLIVTRTVATEDSPLGTDVAYAPRSTSSIFTGFSRRIVREDPTIDLGDLARALNQGDLSFQDYLDLSSKVVGVMDENVKQALLSVRPPLPEGLQLYSTQQNEMLNQYTNLKIGMGVAQRNAMARELEFDPFDWVEEHKGDYFNAEESSATQELIQSLRLYTTNTNMTGAEALNAAITASGEASGYDSEATRALTELKDRAEALVIGGTPIEGWSE